MLHVLLAATLAALPILSPPVDGPVERPYVAPAGEYGPGHRGVDFRVPPGTPIRAAGPGTVVFAGSVAGARHVVVDHGDRLRSTYSYLARLTVARGDRVEEGTVVGESGGQGPGHRPGVLHFGLRRSGRYVDPAEYLPGAAPTIRLAPVGGGPPPAC